MNLTQYIHNLNFNALGIVNHSTYGMIYVWEEMDPPGHM